jgi:sugar lactone lactonase YvrE
MIVGKAPFKYTVVEGWGDLPKGWAFGDVVGLATDSRDNVYVFNRSPHPVIVFDRKGRFLHSWGETLFRRPHGITISAEDVLFLTDEYAHVMYKCTKSGDVLMTLGTKNCPSDTGYDGRDYHTIQRPGGPFNRPTKTALSPSGDIYIADGYGNCQVHKFDPQGNYIFSWGEPGEGPGQFRIPHGICVDDQGIVYVADRENQRVQLFTPNGEFIDQWRHIRRPNDLYFSPSRHIFVASMFAIQTRNKVNNPLDRDAQNGVLPSYISIWSLKGERIVMWGDEDACAPGNFWAAHGLGIDSHGDLYVGEIVTKPGRGPAPPECHALQKFKRLRV